MKKFTGLLSTFKVGNVTFRNRMFGAPNVLLPEGERGKFVENFASYTESKAAGGLAAVTIGDMPLDFKALLSLSAEELGKNDSFKLLKDLAGRINRHGAVSSAELISPGCNFPEGMIASYGFLMGPSAFTDGRGNEVVEMDASLRKRVIDDYAKAARVLKKAGFGMIMIQGGHLWLLNQWLSPLWNKRTDEYGGPIGNRARFPIEVIDGIRAGVGRDMLIEYRLSGDDLIEGGNRIGDIIEFVKMIEDRIDIVHVSSGSMLIPEKEQIGLTLFGPYGNNIHLAEAVKRSGAKIPVSVVGNIMKPELMEEWIADGKADFLSMARAVIADPDLAVKLAEGRRDEIIPCQRCFNCMNDRRRETGRDINFECAVNPYTYKHLDRSLSKNPRRILVAGGGPGGINAAFTAAMKGHKVILAEKSDSLGGILKFTYNDTVKPDLKLYLTYLMTMLKKYNVKIVLNMDVTDGYVRSESPDVLFVASGAVPLVPEIKGIENAYHALDIFRDRSLLKGGKTVMIGGGYVGCETAVHIANLGQEVTVVEMRDRIGADVFVQQYGGLMAAFAERKIRKMPGVRCTEITESGIKGIDNNGKEVFIEADNAVYGLGMSPVTSVYEQLKGSAPKVIPIGDCRKPGKIIDAVYDAVYGVMGLD